MKIEDGIVRPVFTDRSPRLGPVAIMVATAADFEVLHKRLILPDGRKLFLSRIAFDAHDPRAPSLVGPLMGAPYAVMVFETLAAWGVQTVLFLGWCGSVNSSLRNGDIVLPDSAIVDEGTSLHYHQVTGAIVRPHAEPFEALQQALIQRQANHCAGRVWSTDGIFRETPAQISKFKAQGAVAVEMEVSALFSSAQFYDLTMAALLVVSDELFDDQWRPGFKTEMFKASRLLACDLLTDICRRVNHD